MDVVTTYLEQVVDRLRSLLGDELVGVYAGGSWALGAFSLTRSDLDVAGVSGRLVPQTLKTEIAAALRHESLPCPARGLEFVLYPESTVRRPSAGAAFELNLNTGREMAFTLETDPSEAPRHWYVIDRSILREHGRRLFGPPARELFAAIPRDVLLGALSESLRWHQTHGEARADDAVLNACRAWRFAADGVWSSKHDAGLWAGARLDDAALVSQALALRDREERLDQDGVNAFLARVQDVLQLDAA
jgi:hypothetical protein